ncbi:MAG: LEA type 2 family protein [Bacteroidota bacterium]|nr:LEA type 2 family protein [Bacteroidota bacterium]
MKKHIFFLIGFLSLGLLSCGDFQEVSFSGVENVRIVKLSQQGAEAEITARIKNPNSSAFTIYKSDLDVTLNGINCGPAQLTKNVRVKARSEEAYTFRIKSDFSKLNMAELPKLMGIAMSKSVKVGLKGNLKVGKFLIKKSYPVNMTQSVPVSGI